jgi:hypothetical protein
MQSTFKQVKIKSANYPISLSAVFIIMPFLVNAASPNPPDNLRNPIGTSDKPYFGWYINDSDGTALLNIKHKIK